MSNVQLARDVYDAFGRGDIPAVLDTMDPDIEWREAEGNPYKPDGKAGRGPAQPVHEAWNGMGWVRILQGYQIPGHREYWECLR